MPNEDFLGESLRKIAKGAGFVLIGTLIGRAFGYGSRMIIARLGASDYGLVALGTKDNLAFEFVLRIYFVLVCRLDFHSCFPRCEPDTDSKNLRCWDSIFGFSK
jgi:hypothetical protein